MKDRCRYPAPRRLFMVLIVILGLTLRFNYHPAQANIDISCPGDLLVTIEFDAPIENEYRLQGSGPGLPSTVEISSAEMSESFAWTLPGPGTWQIEMEWHRYLLDWDVSMYSELLQAECLAVYIPEEPVEDSSPGFDPGDARINRHAYAGAAVYCDAENSRISIYKIDPLTTEGIPAIFIPYADLPDTPINANLLIAAFDDVEFYRLTSGEYSVSVGPDAEGKWYQAVFDGCPHTYVQSYTFQNGVQIATEYSSH